MIDRPRWRDDSFVIMMADPSDEYHVQVFCIAKCAKKQKQRETLYDEFAIPNLLLGYQSKFMNTAV